MAKSNVFQSVSSVHGILNRVGHYQSLVTVADRDILKNYMFQNASPTRALGDCVSHLHGPGENFQRLCFLPELSILFGYLGQRAGSERSDRQGSRVSRRVLTLLPDLAKAPSMVLVKYRAWAKAVAA